MKCLVMHGGCHVEVTQGYVDSAGYSSGGDGAIAVCNLVLQMPENRSRQADTILGGLWPMPAAFIYA